LRGAAKSGARRFQKYYRDLILAKQERPLEELVKLAIERSGIIEDLEESDPTQAEARKENIDELAAAISEFALNHENATLEAFLEEIALYTDIDSWDETQDAITLMTLHSAKGLEFPIVFISGLEEGLFPLSRAIEEPSQLEEERRLFYVGITRARERLYLSYAQKRMRFGEMLSIKSRFVDELPDDCIDFEDLTFGGEYFSANQSKRIYTSDKFDQNEDHIPGDNFAHLKIGKTIIHPTWGEGRIISRQGSSDNTKVEVAFKWGGRKKLVAKYANLKLRK
jgi:DNA helicase-2/ATP-dependent DNA helicase PcrA